MILPAFFALLAPIFLVLSATRGTPPARKTWRIGVIFAVVALLILLVHTR